MAESKNLANPEFMRDVSDGMDKLFGWEGDYKNTSKVRASLHAGWHYGAGIVTQNEKEFERAREQFEKVRAPSPTRK